MHRLLTIALLFAASAFAGGNPVTTYHNDNFRSGWNSSETALTTANVSSTTFGKVFSYAVDGYVYAQPLYMPGLNVNGAKHNVVFMATEGDSVYAFDADHSGPALWRRSFTDQAHKVTTVPSGDVGTGDLIPQIGITGTPVIDPASGTLYVVAKTKEASAQNINYVQRLHALDIATGNERTGSPVVIAASVPGNCGVTDGQGNVIFSSLIQAQRPALLLSHGVVYIGWASHGDNGPYSGWLMGYDARSLQQVGVFNTVPNDHDPNHLCRAGIWQGGGGPAADAAGNIYFATGNGTFDANREGGQEYGDSILKLAANEGLSVSDYFTPDDEASLNQFDTDLGSGGVLLLPPQPGQVSDLLVQSGKEGTIYLLDRNNFGQFDSHGNRQILQSLNQAIGGVWGTPVYANGTVYFSGSFDTIKAFVIQNGKLNPTPVQSPGGFGFPGPGLAISSAADGSNAILWAIDPQLYTAHGPCVLHAYNAANVAQELYNSKQNAQRDDPGGAVKFAVPLVANGRVYVGAVNKVSVYGLLH